VNFHHTIIIITCNAEIKCMNDGACRYVRLVLSESLTSSKVE